MTKTFYIFDQNNSFGEFVIDDEKGIGNSVIIEASTKEEATEKAERIGLYFDGNGDCPCCGNRWHEIYSSYDIAKTREEAIERVTPSSLWSSLRECAFIHYHNGKVEKIVFNKEEK